MVALRAWAEVAGDRIAREAAREHAAGLAARMLSRPLDPARCTSSRTGWWRWPTSGRRPALVDVPEYPNLMPGFSQGTAGVAYALLRAAVALGRTT